MKSHDSRNRTHGAWIQDAEVLDSFVRSRYRRGFKAVYTNWHIQCQFLANAFEENTRSEVVVVAGEVGGPLEAAERRCWTLCVLSPGCRSQVSK